MTAEHDSTAVSPFDALAIEVRQVRLESFHKFRQCVVRRSCTCVDRDLWPQGRSFHALFETGHDGLDVGFPDEAVGVIRRVFQLGHPAHQYLRGGRHVDEDYRIVRDLFEPCFNLLRHHFAVEWLSREAVPVVHLRVDRLFDVKADGHIVGPAVVVDVVVDAVPGVHLLELGRQGQYLLLLLQGRVVRVSGGVRDFRVVVDKGEAFAHDGLFPVIELVGDGRRPDVLATGEDNFHGMGPRID